MKNYKKNKILLEKTFNYKSDMEHDACGVGLIATTDGKKSRKVVEYGIEALKAIWHRGAVDADGKSGDGAGIQIEIAPEFFKEKILATGHSPDDEKRICVGMVFLPRTDYSEQEKCREIIESALEINKGTIASGDEDWHSLWDSLGHLSILVKLQILLTKDIIDISSFELKLNS